MTGVPCREGKLPWGFRLSLNPDHTVTTGGIKASHSSILPTLTVRSIANFSIEPQACAINKVNRNIKAKYLMQVPFNDMTLFYGTSDSA